MQIQKVTISYSRTIQAEPFHPITPTAAIEMELTEDDNVEECMAYGRELCRQQVKAEFTGCVPKLAARMDTEFVRRWVAQAEQYQIDAMNLALVERSQENGF